MRSRKYGTEFLNRNTLQDKALKITGKDGRKRHDGCSNKTPERSLTLDTREKHGSAIRPASGRGVCAVMACSDMQEAVQVGRCLSELNMGCLVTYLKAEDLVLNTPAGPVALVILATDDSTAVLRRTLIWLRNRWPGCPISVVGNAGCGDYEMAARENGAMYLTRPVRDAEWSAILSHAFSRIRKLLADAGKQDAVTKP